jgi:SSS family solute:Na+ symporter
MNARNRVVPLLLVVLSAAVVLRAGTANGSSAPPSADVNESLRQRALSVLRTAMEAEDRWIKVHAAEALLSLGYPRGVARTFEKELASKGGEPQYRIGIWRVLAQAAPSDRQREPWMTKILAAVRDPRGPDRLHGAETLGKLGYRAGEMEADAFEAIARSGPGPLAANARWVLANSGRPDGDIQLAELLASDDAGTRATAAYAIRHLPKLSAAAWEKLAAAVRKEPGGDVDIVRVSLVSAAFVHAPVDQKARFKTDLLKYARTGTNDAKYEACAALATQGRNDDLPLLTGLLDDTNADVRVGAAHAILRILKAP